ncbi:unnamed protein product [Adineta steineri]|uniref:Amine oxidase domain-containing protein n=1 Tax=Adineta steineri TaxID=433720 RepID=A0A814T8L1_9BILA|nr:unnamed protein product [Adineta steineri]CAF0885131.1 unnamed protein product [Adineta steineri]CAF1158194.1 unnamed protein product [Adineta steineri]CAF1590804.1 unnamed protein product [Adineta steineri]
MKVILIGAGISSAIISLLLRRQYGPAIKLVVFDKGRSIGGRMTTSFDSEENPHCSVDTGAQYLTLTKSNSITTKFFQQLIDDHVIELLDKQNTIGIRENQDKIDYTAPRGIASIVRYFFEQAVVEMNLSKQITKIDFNSTNDKFTISTDKEQIDEAEAVIVTIPVPQVLCQLQGSITQLIDQNKEVKENLSQIKYSSRFAVGLFYSSSVTNLNIPWRIYYVDKKEHECLRFLAIDNAKRNKNEPPFSLIAQTSVEFGAKHIDDDKMIIGEEIKEKIFQFLPELSRDISNTKYHKWKYSQVIQSYPNQPGYVVLNEHPLLMLAGDSFAADSNFEACIQAAIESVKKIHPLTT